MEYIAAYYGRRFAGIDEVGSRGSRSDVVFTRNECNQSSARRAWEGGGHVVWRRAKPCGRDE